MAGSAEFVVEISANLKAIKSALAGVQRDITNLKTNAAKPGPGIDLGLDKARTQIAGVVGSVKALIASYAGFQGLTGLGRIADEAQVLNARLRLATRNQEQFNLAQRGTFDIAQATRTSVASTIDLYSRLERSTRELGTNQSTLLQLTESINQAAQISGGGPGAEAALFQLSQGLASGVLRGEELNSVLEQTPRIGQAIADGLNVPIGALRKLAEEGKLTSKVIGDAILSQREVLNEEFAKLPLTISGAFTQLRNSFALFVGQADQAAGASSKVANAIAALARNLPQVIDAALRVAAVFASYVVTMRILPGLLLAATLAQTKLADASKLLAANTNAAGKAVAFLQLQLARLQLGIPALVAGLSIGGYLRENFAEAEAAGIYLVRFLLVAVEKLKLGFNVVTVDIGGQFDRMWAAIKNAGASALNGLAGALESLPFSSSRAAGAAVRAAAESLKSSGESVDETKRKIAELTAEAEKNIATIRKITDEQIDDTFAGSIAERERRAAEQERLRLEAELAAQQLKLGDGPPAADKSKFNERLVAVADENALIIDNIDRALSDLENRYEDNLVSLTDYYRRRSELQTESIDAELASKRLELSALQKEAEGLRTSGGDNTSNIEAQSRLLADIVVLERDRAAIGAQSAREQAAAERELADELLKVRARLAEASGQTAESRRLQIETEFSELIGRFKAEGNQAGVEFVERLINVEAARARLDELSGQISETLQTLRANEDNITAQIEAGLIGQARGEEELQNLRERSIEQLARYRDALEAAYNAARDPAIQNEIRKRLVELDTETARVTATTQRLRNQLTDIGQQGLEQFFNDLMSGTKSIGDAFRGLIGNIAASIGRLASENVARAILGQVGSAFGGGGGDFFGSITKFFAGIFHRGGIVGRGAVPGRMVPAWAFAGAPRFHSGGIAGMKQDEVPAVLQKGEEVLAKNDPRNAANGGGQQPFRVVNVLDPRLAGDYLESSEGERVILNVIGKNPGQVRQLLG